MTGWQFFVASVGAVVRHLPALLRITALWWVLTTILAMLASYVMTGLWGSVATLRPDVEGGYPDLLATFLMVSLVINLLSIGLVASLALPVLVGGPPPRGILPIPAGSVLVSTIWASVLVGLLMIIGTTAISALFGQIVPFLPLEVGFVLFPLITIASLWVLWVLLLRVFLQPIDFRVDPDRRVGIPGQMIAAVLFCAVSLALFLPGTVLFFSAATEAIVTSVLGWIVLMLALSAVAVRVTRDE